MWCIETAGLVVLRLDTFPYVGRAFWHDFHAQLYAIYPHLTTVGEIFNPDRPLPLTSPAELCSRESTQDSTLLSTSPCMSHIRNVLIRGASMTQVSAVLRQDRLYPHPQNLVTFSGTTIRPGFSVRKVRRLGYLYPVYLHRTLGEG